MAGHQSWNSKAIENCGEENTSYNGKLATLSFNIELTFGSHRDPSTCRDYLDDTVSCASQCSVNIPRLLSCLPNMVFSGYTLAI